jgi:5,10-methylenetetrahydromethanopterin reductase
VATGVNGRMTSSGRLWIDSLNAGKESLLNRMRLGVVAGPLGAARNVIPIAQAAEKAGFELLGLGDNQSLWRDVYVSLTLASEATSNIRLGPCVTNMVTRNLAVTTSAIATIDEMSGGRAFLGLGPGDSAVYNVGARPARLAEVEAGVKSIRSMLSGHGAVDRGRSMHVRWSTHSLPICVSAEGPKGLAMAGRVADGVFVSFGLSAPDLQAAEQHIAAGALAAGRAPGSIEVWHAARVSIAGSQDEAMRLARTGMASVAHHALRLSPEAKGVPIEFLPALKELNAPYRPTEHAEFGDSFNARLVEELGLMPYLVNRYALAGTPEQCAKRVSELAGLGIRRLLLMFSGPDLEAQIHRWRQDVMPLAGVGARWTG